MMPWLWPGTKPVFCVAAAQNPAVCGGMLLQHCWAQLGCRRMGLAASGLSAVCVGLQNPSTGRRRSAASPPWAATPSGGSGTPQSVSTGHGPACPAALHGSQGAVCSLLYCLVRSPTTKRWEFGKRPFPDVSKLFSVNYLIVWVQPSAKCYHYIVHYKKKKKLSL